MPRPRRKKHIEPSGTDSVMQRYYKLDEIGFVGFQDKRTKEEVKAEALRTTKSIKRSKAQQVKQKKRRS